MISLLILAVFFVQKIPYNSSTINENQNTELKSPAYQIVMGSKIDLNNATTYDLTLVPGIGFKTATRIIEDKTLNGNFKSVLNLTRVDGVGVGKAEKFSKFLFVSANHIGAAEVIK